MTRRTVHKADDFQLLWNCLVANIERAAAKTFGPTDRQMLKKTIYEATLMYDRVQWSAEDTSTFHELGAPLPRVIEILKHDANRERLLIALGAPAPGSSTTSRLTWPESDRPAVERAAAEYEAGLRFLDKIARAVPPPPPARPAHRPSKTKDLRGAVEVLANYWERETGTPFTQGWHKGAPRERGGDGRERLPNSPAAQFVYDVVKLIDPERLGELPGVTETIVADRRAAKDRDQGAQPRRSQHRRSKARHRTARSAKRSSASLPHFR